SKLGRALADAPTDVLLVEDRGQRWKNYGLPTSRLYLSASLIRSIDYENELAAVLAFELGHLTKRHALKRLSDKPQQQPGVEYFGPNGIFAFNEEQQLEAAAEAVNIMYRAGYDPRGLV